MTPVLTHCVGRIGHITLNRPAAMNAITVDLARALAAAVIDLGAATDVIVLRGAGGNFSVGGDVKELERLHAEGPEALRTLFASFGRACAATTDVPVPVVAAVEGYAFAGGFELMLASDIVVIREDARIGDHHANFGMIPGGGSSQRLPRLVGRQRALGLLLSGEHLTGRDAVAWGLAYRSAPAAKFEEVLNALVQRLAHGSRTASVATKALVRTGLERPLAVGLAQEIDAVVEHLQRPDALARFARLGETR